MSTSLDTPPFVEVRYPGGVTRLFSGDLIGRVAGAALMIDDPRVSEAHGLVSLRRGQFVLLALRRLLMLGSVPSREVRLRPGIRVGLAPELWLEVTDLHLPTKVLMVESDGLTPRRLGPATSIFGGTTPRVLGRFDPAAPCHIWSFGDEWRIRVGGQQRTLTDGSTVELSDKTFLFRSLDLSEMGAHTTQQPAGGFGRLHLVTYFDGIAIHRENHATLTIGGVGARIVSELAAFAGPAPWLFVAREVWDDGKERTDIELRQRWDTSIRRLRIKFREAGVRSDLVRADGVGNYQLVLEANDLFEDRT